jgi:tRNA(fMet)-specific endonuclease VapC
MPRFGPVASGGVHRGFLMALYWQEIAKRKPPEVLSRFESLGAGDVAMSLITYGELLYGTARSATAKQATATIRKLIEAVTVLPMEPEVGTHYGAIRALLTAAGTPIGGNDLWIAAHARASRLTLVTNNESEFRRVPELRVENWVDPAGN